MASGGDAEVKESRDSAGYLKARGTLMGTGTGMVHIAAKRLLVVLAVAVTLLSPRGGQGSLVAAAEDAGADAAAPVVFRIEPSNGPTKGGLVITIEGRHFGSAKSVDPHVTVGGAACNTVFWVSSTSVLCDTPDGVGSDRSVIVEVDSKSSIPSKNARFKYDEPKVLGIEPGEKRREQDIFTRPRRRAPKQSRVVQGGGSFSPSSSPPQASSEAWLRSPSLLFALVLFSRS